MAYLFKTCLLAIFASAISACIHNATHCQCIATPPGQMCLRFINDTESTPLCEVYECGHGSACDCLGTDLCEINTCETKPTYRATSIIPPGSVSDIVQCETISSSSSTCLKMIGPLPPSPSASPTATSSASPTASPSSTPIESVPVVSSAVFPFPGGRPGHVGEPCAGNSCAPGLTCRCSKEICVPDVSYTIRLIADNSVSLYSCDGNEIGNIPTLRTIESFSYSGICQNLIAVVHNNVAESGMAIAIEFSGATYASGVNLPISVAKQPILAGYISCCSYDYNDPPFMDSIYLPAYNDSTRFPEYFEFAQYGGATMQSYPGEIDSNTDFVYMISLPFCN